MPSRRTLAGLLALAALAALARGPLHAATFALPVSNDDAIPLLMARHLLRGELSTTLWNQPYNGTLDTYLLAPGLLLASPHAVFRLYEIVCAVLLVAAVGALARRAGGGLAGWMAAGLAAVGTPYMALMTATGPTPNFLVPLLVSLVLLGVPPEPGTAVSPVRAFLLALLGGLAVWDSALALPALLGGALGLLALGHRPRPRTLALATAGLLLGLAPVVAARLIGAAGASTVTALRPSWLWMAGLSDLLRAGVGLFGLQVPLVVDGPERWVPGIAVQLLLLAALGLPLVAGLMEARALPLAGWSAALCGAFALSRRTGGDELRYLYGLVVPALALLGVGLARAWRERPLVAAGAALLIVLPWTGAQWHLARVWSDPRHAASVWQVPPLDPVLDTLRRAGTESAYASLQFAGRLTLDSGGAVIASQAWNERIPGDPLRFRDEVDLDPAASWVLSPHLSRGMPRASGFRDLLRVLGGSWHEDAAGDFAVFRAFRPPYDEARAVPRTELAVRALDGADPGPAVLDRDVRTGWRAGVAIARGSGLQVRLAAPRRLSALLLVLDREAAALSVPWVCTVDGTVAAQGPARFGLQWLNGAPRAARQRGLAVVLPGAVGSEIRLVFQGAGPPLAVQEVFVYGPDEPASRGTAAALAAQALAAARAGDWDRAVAGYERAVAAEPERAALHACLARARDRAASRRRLDVESLGDGGEEFLGR